MGTTFRSSRQNERGSILILSAVGLVVAIISASLAIDLGFLAHEIRVDQKVADLAAMDAIRVLPTDPTVAAQQSATRNVPTFASSGYSLTVKWGPSKTGPWSSLASDLAAATAVQVTATSPHTNYFPFVSVAPSKSRTAVATSSDKAQFSIGSDLASVDTSASSIANLNKVTTAILGNSTAVNLTAVGYQGLAGGSVSLADLVAADPSLGTADSLLTSTVTVRRLAQAAVIALNNKGDAASLAAATPLGTFANTINTSLSARLGDILTVEQPASPGSIAAGTQFNVYDLIVGAGELAISNGTHFVTVPNLTIGVPGLASSSLKLTVIEAPRISAFGPAQFDATTGTWATTAHTAQIALELTTHIVVAVPPVCVVVCLPSALSVDLQLPLSISAAKATGSLTDVRCPTVSGTHQADILVDTQAANATSAAVLAVSLLGIPLSLPPLINTNVALGGGSSTLTFGTPPPLPSAIQSTAATGAGLTSATTSQFTVLGANLGAVTALLSPVTTAIDTQILGTVFNALGLSVGGADVRALRIDCGVPGLAA